MVLKCDIGGDNWVISGGHFLTLMLPQDTEFWYLAEIMWNLKVFCKKLNDVYLILMKKMQMTSIVLDLGTTFMLNPNNNDTIWFHKTRIYKVFNGKNGQ